MSRAASLMVLVGIAGLAIPLSDCRCGRSSQEVVIYTSVDQVFAEPVLRRFERKTGIRVRAVYDTEETKSTGILNRLLAEASHPRADVFWSGDPVRPQVLVRRGLAARYAPPTARDLPTLFHGPRWRWVGFSARARVLLVNTHQVPAGQEPRSVRDYAAPRWKGRVAIANPAYGTTTMHMAALFSRWGATRGDAFLRALRQNHVRIASSNGEVKRLVVSGEVAWGLVDTDDAAVARRSGAPVKIIYPDQQRLGTLLVPTAAVILRGAPHTNNARRLLDYLASHDVERQLAFAPCAQLPLRASVKRPAGMPNPSALRLMRVDYAHLGAVMEAIHPYLRDWATGRSGLQPPRLPASGASAPPRTKPTAPPRRAEALPPSRRQSRPDAPPPARRQ